MKNLASYILLAIISIVFFLLPTPDQQFSKTPETDKIIEAKVTEAYPSPEGQTLEIVTENNQEITAPSDFSYQIYPQTYHVGDKVTVLQSADQNGQTTYSVIDYVRRDSLTILFTIFVIAVILITGFTGATSMLGMIFSFLILFKFSLPQILTGKDPVLIAIISAIFIIPISFYLSHGFNKKTSTAVVGTLITLIIIGFLANYFVVNTHLTGLATDDASFLGLYAADTIDFRGLLMAGIIISLLGILDDITISQSAIVQELKVTKKSLTFKELYSKAMGIGRDHIASIVNTLILVYAGASLPLMLLFLDQSRSISEVLNFEVVAQEIIIMLLGSLGLVLAVPITTLLACFVTSKHDHLDSHDHHHHH